MTEIKITKVGLRLIEAQLKIQREQISVPIRIEGQGMTRFSEVRGEKRLTINPDVILVSKNKTQISSIKDISLGRVFGKTHIQGISTEAPFSPFFINLGDIKEMWTDTSNAVCDTWNIEV